MANPFKTPEFKKLFKKWNKKLEKAGHEEIEDFSRPEAPLMDWDSLRFRKRGMDQRQQYYEAAEALLPWFKFKNKTHRRIWELHAQGLSGRKIAAMINRKGYGVSNVCLFIRQIQRASGLKNGCG